MATPAAPPEEPKISDVCGSCQDLFLKCAKLPQRSQDARDRAELLRQRFRIWALNIGVFTSSNATLDERLEHSDEVRGLVVQLLSLMERNLKFVTDSHASDASGEILVLPREDGTGKIQGTASEALDAIEATINRLNRVSVTIRKSSTADLENRVMNFTKKYPDAKYPQLARKIVQFKYRTAMPSLQDQLAVSMVNRRQRLRYSRRHQLKLQVGTSAVSQPKEQAFKAQPTTQVLRPLPVIPKHRGDNAAGRQSGTSHDRQRQPDISPARYLFARRQIALSNTHASGPEYKPTPSEIIRMQRDERVSVISSKNSTTFFAEDLEGFPAPPKIDGSTPPPCPYCGKLLEESELELVKWRRHVRDDVQPYICISDTCEQPPDPFKDFDSWAKHMRELHSMKWTQQVHKPIAWRCDVDHAAETFFVEAAFREHLNVEHSEYSVAQQDAIYRSCKVIRRRRRNVCPMCNVDVAAMAAAESMCDNNKPGKLTEFEQLHKLAKHVAGHLCRLAFDSAGGLDAADYDDLEATIATTNGKVCRTGSMGCPPSGAGHLSSVRLDLPERPGMFLWRIVLTRVIYHLRSRHYWKPSGDFDIDWSVSDLNDLSRRAFLSFYDHASEERNPSGVLPWSDTIAILKERMDPNIREEYELRVMKDVQDPILEHIMNQQRGHQRHLPGLRLLSVKKGIFNLSQLTDDDLVPSYAILSHTWGADSEEVTFDDMINGIGEDKPGYDKIRFCAEQARKDGLQYFWIDTCCINKTNDAELSRSINSMFQWYSNATRCYVYLSDVSCPIDTNDDYDLLLWESDFRKSKWFTRGWTLQELLAPRAVEFFCREGRRLGDKNSLQQQIQEITGIPALALQGAQLSRFSVDERFSWMEYRQTTLEVDRAYSLLGILDIKIPLFKDIEATTAFRQLQEVIDKREKYIKELCLTDPRYDKKCIEDTKGGLLEDSYCWILETSKFKQWRNTRQSPLLWIKGDPGKGKTMLLCGIINELEKTTVDMAILSYFFCQASDSRTNSATAVLRGLLYMLVGQRPSLVSYIQKKYDHLDKTLFEDTNAWFSLSEIFTTVLQDPSLAGTYLIVDGLDECVIGLPKLLDLIVYASSVSFRVKWIVSSRNWPDIEERLVNVSQNLSLELNAESVSAAISIFIRHKVLKLAQRKKYSNKIQDAVLDYLSLNANGTFLWVALVCQDLEKIPKLATLARVNDFPPGLDALYERMIKQIRNSGYNNLCNQILALIAIVYRPVTMTELTSLIVSDDVKSLQEIIGFCGSFLTVQKDAIYFVHQSAKDYLLLTAFNEIFPSGMEGTHYNIFLRSLQVLSRTLRQDIYNLSAPGFCIDQLIQPNPDPLASARYSCLYWVDHLIDCDIRGNIINDLKDSGLVYTFLSKSYLYWLEALSLMKCLPDGIVMIMKLENLQVDKSPDLHAFIYDAKRFALYNRPVIEQVPLQLYCSALVFSPKKSIVRETFKTCIPSWIQSEPRVQVYWTAALQTLEGHSGPIKSVAFSPDGKQVASGSYNKTVQLWDATTGAVLQILKGHLGPIHSVAFSPDSKQIVSGSGDETIRLWDTITGAALQTFEGYLGPINSVAFSPDGKQVVSGSWDSTVQLWDAITGAALQTFEGHLGPVNSVAFSPDGKQVVSGSYDKTIRLWDAVTGAVPQMLKGRRPRAVLQTLIGRRPRAVLQTLEGHSGPVNSVAFSPDSKQVVSGSWDETVRLWDAVTGAVLQTLEGHSGPVNSVAFSPDSKKVISGSRDETVKLWDTVEGAALQTLEGHLGPVNSVAFSPDSKQVVSGSWDETVRLWDAIIGAKLQTLEGHSGPVKSVAFSLDGKQVVSGSRDKTVRLWDTLTGAVLQTFEGHSGPVNSVAFSPDSRKVVSGSYDKTVRLWDAITGATLQTLEGHSGPINSVAFSPDSKQVVSGSFNKTVQLWDTVTGAILQILEGHLSPVYSVAFSLDGKKVVSGSYDKTVRLWNAATGAALQTLEGHSGPVNSVTFSPDSKKVISGSWDKTIRLWDARTGTTLQTLEGYSGPVNSIAFLPDGNLLPTLRISNHWVVEGKANIIWLPPDYWSTCEAFWDKTVILGHSSGRLSFLQFRQGQKLVVQN